MKKGLYDFYFTRSCLLNGVGLLACCAPSVCREPVQFSYDGIGQYFQNVGYYLHAAVEIECPEIAKEFHQKQQLEFHLPS